MMDRLATILTGAHVGWILESDRVERLTQIQKEIGSLEHELSQYCGKVDLMQELGHDDMKPLVQTFAVPMTSVARAMVYCVLRGATVLRIAFDYELKRHAKLAVVLDINGTSHNFECSDLWDAEVLRHFGMMKMGDRPVIHGYFAFRDYV